jgi:acyl carrier protein
MNDNPDQRLLEVLRRYVTDPGEWQAVLEGAPLLASTGLDSLSIVNLVTEIELIFDARFDPDSLKQALQDVHSLDAFLESAQGKIL